MVEDEVSEGFKDWERIQSSKEWSMVVIRDSLSHEFSVFPPMNHEGLHISSQSNRQNPETPETLSPSPSPSQSQSPLSSSSSPSDETGEDPPSSSPSDSRIRQPGDISAWFGIGLEVLRSKVLGIVSSFQYNAAVRGVVRPFASVTGAVTVVLLSLLCMWVRRRRHQRCLKESRDHLMLLVKEKDEKIMQLLTQIAQMNEVLLARHRVQ